MTEDERIKRVNYHVYGTCEGISEHAERIVALEEVAGELRDIALTLCGGTDCNSCAIVSGCNLAELDTRLDRLLAE